MQTETGSNILTINGGSSSIKFAIFEKNDSLRRVFEGKISGIGQPQSNFSVKDLSSTGSSVNPSAKSVRLPDQASAKNLLMSWLLDHSKEKSFAAIGHRVVQGGLKYNQSQSVTKNMLKDLNQLSGLEPLHLPEELSLMQAAHDQFPRLPQVACFDTSFHRDLPRVAQQLAIPRRYEAQGVRRYGFHGLSYAFLMQELQNLDGKKAFNGRVILAHLGGGASLAAVHYGQSVDTSMGFTPTSGILMGTRSGDIDPGLVRYLALKENFKSQDFDDLFNFKSGLLGISETSSEMHELLELEGKDIRAAEAIALFCYQVKKCIGSFAAVLGGVDTLIFSGGIGENSPLIRNCICEGLQFLGIELEAQKNIFNEALISKNSSQVSVRVIRTDEELMIAKEVCRVLEL